MSDGNPYPEKEESLLPAKRTEACMDLRRASDAASACKAIVTATAMTISGRKYVRVEGWQAIAVAHGCVASARDVERVQGGFRAIGEVRRGTDGIVLATAEGFLGDDEQVWEKRPEYAKRAMAQTRAISRACRSAFAHVVVMMQAGLETTPAEEVPEGGFVDVPHSVRTDTEKPAGSAPRATPKRSANGDFYADGEIQALSSKAGSGKKGPWTRWGVKVGGDWYGTFDEGIGAELEAIGEGGQASFKWDDDGKGHRNIVAMEPSGRPAAGKPESKEDGDQLPM